jgi:hypothetical protein
MLTGQLQTRTAEAALHTLKAREHAESRVPKGTMWPWLHRTAAPETMGLEILIKAPSLAGWDLMPFSKVAASLVALH